MLGSRYRSTSIFFSGISGLFEALSSLDASDADVARFYGSSSNGKQEPFFRGVSVKTLIDVASAVGFELPLKKGHYMKMTWPFLG